MNRFLRVVLSLLIVFIIPFTLVLADFSVVPPATSSIAACGKGGTYCPNNQSCLQAGGTKYCVSGNCMTDPGSTCQMPPANLLPCGSGGTLCFESMVCIANNTQTLCTQGDCLFQATCQAPVVLPCGQGGTTCPLSKDLKKQTYCILTDQSNYCTSGACMTGGAMCQPSTALPCGKGGTFCPANSVNPAITNVCMLADQSAACVSGDCMSQSSSVCQNAVVLPCGQGGTTCAAGTSCVLHDDSGLCTSGDCMKGGAYCKVPTVLPCGQGGTTCATGTSCVMKDNSGLCLNGNCMSNGLSSCQAQAVLPCGQGGTTCATGLSCIRADGSALCTTADCMNGYMAKCQPATALPCGKGGTTCPISSDPVQQTVCMLDNQSAACTSGSCMSGGASCQLYSALPCGQGGTTCPLSSDPTQQTVCIANTTPLVSAGSTTTTTPVPGVNTTPAVPTLCTSGACLTNASCQMPTHILPCGSGGTACPTSVTPSAQTYCMLGDNSAACLSGPCMSNRTSLCSLPSSLPCGNGATACPYWVSTIAGNGKAGSTGDNAPALTATMSQPNNITIDSLGNIYIADAVNQNIRKIDANGFIHTVATNINVGSLAVDSSNNLYAVDNASKHVVQYNAQTYASTIIAGNDTSGYGTGAAYSLNLSTVWGGLAVDKAGNVYIADTYNHVIKKLTLQNGVYTMSIIAGVAGQAGYDDNLAGKNSAAGAKLNFPEGLAIDTSGALYIADEGNHVIRKLTPNTATSGAVSYAISTIVGTAGSVGMSGDNGPATNATLSAVSSIAVDNVGNLYIADSNNHIIRFVSAISKTISTIAGQGGKAQAPNAALIVAATQSFFNLPIRLAIDNVGNVYVADQNNNLIRKLSPQKNLSSATLATLNIPATPAH